jgi:hypothetical protein
MKRNLIASGFVGVFALACSTAAVLAQPDSICGSQQQLLSQATSPLVLVRGGGGGHGGGGHGFGGGHGAGFSGGHGFHGGHFRGGFGAFGSPYYDDDYGEPGCWWSARSHRWVCY